MKQKNGFTLIELMVTVAVVGIFLTVGVPAFQTFLGNNRLLSQTNDFVSTFMFARSEAVTRNATVAVCPSADGATCSSTTNWAPGWIVFADDNGNGALDAPADTLLRAWPALDGQSTLVRTSINNAIVFQSTGMADAAANFDLTYPGCTGSQRRSIDVFRVGRVKSERVSC